MSDKSPRQHMTEKAGKSIKEKRAAKRAKGEAQNNPLAPPAQQGGAKKRS